MFLMYNISFLILPPPPPPWQEPTGGTGDFMERDNVSDEDGTAINLSPDSFYQFR
jgi:hypothetical protein